MFFEGENDKQTADEFRPEVHDSDGLLMQSGAGNGSGALCATRRPNRSRSSGTPTRAASA
jgi:hypothetical protein